MTESDHDKARRLERGELTDAELANVCHNISPSSIQKFYDGCADEQRKVCGKAERDQILERLKDVEGRLAELECAFESLDIVELYKRIKALEIDVGPIKRIGCE